MKLSQGAAAEALGLSFTQVGIYDRGEKPIYQTLALAMEALERRRFTEPTLSPEGHDLARSEGWGLYANEVDRLEIQRDDEARKFRTDENAVAFVQRRADAGSLLHQTALTIHNKSRVRWANVIEAATAPPR